MRGPAKATPAVLLAGRTVDLSVSAFAWYQFSPEAHSERLRQSWSQQSRAACYHGKSPKIDLGDGRTIVLEYT